MCRYPYIDRKVHTYTHTHVCICAHTHVHSFNYWISFWSQIMLIYGGNLFNSTSKLKYLCCQSYLDFMLWSHNNNNKKKTPFSLKSLFLNIWYTKYKDKIFIRQIFVLETTPSLQGLILHLKLSSLANTFSYLNIFNFFSIASNHNKE
jgi:hypothetical protein